VLSVTVNILRDYCFHEFPLLNLYLKEHLFPVGIISRDDVDALTPRRSHLQLRGVAARDAHEDFDAYMRSHSAYQKWRRGCSALPDSVGVNAQESAIISALAESVHARA
jgi:hypothetical protein